MRSEIIRREFIRFFEHKKHQQVPAAPIVQKEDPMLLFTNAGMVQFKEFFLDHQLAPYQQVTSTQPCLRVSGKHNDLEEVGLDAYHHTMFEMLGNWSFGAYFKQEAISWAWELLTKVYQIPPTKLYITVFGGDSLGELQADQETYHIWKQYVSADSILYGTQKDNFWEMGDIGPCGFSTEIHIDLRPEKDLQQIPGKALVNTGHKQVVELWNLVFIQYNRLASGQLIALPAKHIDTGMGLERLAMALQRKDSSYDTDLFTPLIEAIAQASGRVYGQEEALDKAIRVVADHLRAVVFAIADGQTPTNIKAGYVIRRILRRAVRHGYSYLGFDQPFMYQFVDILAQQFAGVYPAIKQQQAYIEQIIRYEEQSFLRTLATGLRRLVHIGQVLRDQGQGRIDGITAFELYDTYGFPLDLTKLIAQEQGLKVDELGFNQALGAQRKRSQQAAAIDQGDWHVRLPDTKTDFVGYQQLTATVQIVQYRTIQDKGKERYQLVLNQTPFYPAGGGQVGDTGKLITDSEEITILDTQQEYTRIIHYVDQLPSNLKAVWKAVVDSERRKRIASNHSTTHLLHATLRQVLGPHVIQKGSFVSEQLLRFDFAHYAKVSSEALIKIEHIVNQKIRDNIPLQEQSNVPLEVAKSMGAVALFGEKYGDQVRIITFDPRFSRELCGGTHVSATGQIGFFKIVTETSIAAGTRRIEALTADTAEYFINKQLDTLNNLQVILKYPKDLLRAVQQLVQEKVDLSKAVAAYQTEHIRSVITDLHQHRQTIQGVHVIIAKIKLPHVKALKQIAFEFKKIYDPLFLVLAADINHCPYLAVLLSENFSKSATLNAHMLVKELSKSIQGDGGGQSFFATASGSSLAGLGEVLNKAQDILQRYLDANKKYFA